MKKALIIFGIGFLILNSCSKDSGGSGGGGGTGGGGGGSQINCSTVTNKSFNTDVLPIFNAICSMAGCHNTGSGNGPGALTNWPQISTNAGAIRTAVASGSMPKNSTLSTSQKASIICWIDSGAPNN